MFEDLGDLVLEQNASKEEVKRLLGKACGVASEEYRKIRERRSILPECVALFERLGRNMWLYVFAFSDVLVPAD